VAKPEPAPVPPTAAPTGLPFQQPAQAQPHAADRLVTMMLLGFGLVNVVLQIPAYLDIASFADQWMKLMGIPGTFTATSSSQTWGTVAAILFGLGYVVTLLLSLRRLRRGKVTWWLPLVGAVVTSIAAGICVLVPIMNDPAVASYLQQVS
jgi:hypothetical protein